jgi:hypothetical protein
MFRTDIATWVTTGFINTVNDVQPGALVADPVAPRFQGVLGKIFAVENAQAAQLSYTTTGTLRGGLYQYVKVKAAVTLVRGQIVFWDDLSLYQITNVASATLNEGQIAGVCLNVISASQYGFIQIGGLASVLFRASVTDKTIGNLVLQLTTTNTADAIADATGTYISGGVKGLKNIIGTAAEAPTDAGVNLVNLKGITLNL